MLKELTAETAPKLVATRPLITAGYDKIAKVELR
jgi:hypothetical protein